MTNLKQARERANITQRELATRSGVTQRMIQGYEQGERDINKAEALTVYRLAQALGCTVENLLEI